MFQVVFLQMFFINRHHRRRGRVSGSFSSIRAEGAGMGKEINYKGKQDWKSFEHLRMKQMFRERVGSELKLWTGERGRWRGDCEISQMTTTDSHRKKITDGRGGARNCLLKRHRELRLRVELLTVKLKLFGDAPPVLRVKVVIGTALDRPILVVMLISRHSHYPHFLLDVISPITLITTAKGKFVSTRKPWRCFRMTYSSFAAANCITSPQLV